MAAASYSPVNETKYEGASRTVVLVLSALLLLLGAGVVIGQCVILGVHFIGPDELWFVFVPQMITIFTNVLVALTGLAGVISIFNTSRGKVKLFAGLAIAVTVIAILALLVTLGIYYLMDMADDEHKQSEISVLDPINPNYKKFKAATEFFRATLILYGIEIVTCIVSAVMGHRAMGACCFKKRVQRG